MSAITIHIDGEIGRTFFGDGVTAEDVGRQLDAAPDATELHFRLNTPGGDMGETAAIIARARAHGGKIITHADGWAASAGGVLFAIGEERHMAEFAEFMMHRTRTVDFRPMTAPQHEQTAERLRALDDRQIDLFDAVMDDDRAEIEAMLDRETWLTASAAKAHGIATHVTTGGDPVALCHMDPQRYRNTPARAMARASAQRGTMEELAKIAAALGCVANVDTIMQRVTALTAADAELADVKKQLAEITSERDAAQAELITAQATANQDACKRIVDGLRAEGRIVAGSKWEENFSRLQASGDVAQVEHMAELLRDTKPAVPVGKRQSTDGRQPPTTGALPRTEANEVDWEAASHALPDGIRASLEKTVKGGRTWAQIAKTAAGRGAFERAGYDMETV